MDCWKCTWPDHTHISSAIYASHKVVVHGVRLRFETVTVWFVCDPPASSARVRSRTVVDEVHLFIEDEVRRSTSVPAFARLKSMQMLR